MPWLHNPLLSHSNSPGVTLDTPVRRYCRVSNVGYMATIEVYNKNNNYCVNVKELIFLVSKGPCYRVSLDT